MCHIDRETSGARKMKPRDLRAKTEIKKIISVGARKLPKGCSTECGPV
jgi:hypothetical protein